MVSNCEGLFGFLTNADNGITPRAFVFPCFPLFSFVLPGLKTKVKKTKPGKAEQLRAISDVPELYSVLFKSFFYSIYFISCFSCNISTFVWKLWAFV